MVMPIDDETTFRLSETIDVNNLQSGEEDRDGNDGFRASSSSIPDHDIDRAAMDDDDNRDRITVDSKANLEMITLNTSIAS